MPSLFLVMLATIFLVGPSAFAKQIKGKTDQSALYEKTKDRYYRPTPLPEFKMEWPEFELDDDLESLNAYRERGYKRLSAEEIPNSLQSPMELSAKEVQSELLRIKDLMTSKRKNLDEEIAHLQKG